tara:strand:+ start:28063 stop:28575 length:513 start_codon:yes stop_codon:yes gene_type:complete
VSLTYVIFSHFLLENISIILNGKNIAMETLYIINCLNIKVGITMKNKLSAVALFHETFGMGVSSIMKANLGVNKNMLRYNLMDEENKEYLEAAENNDLVEVADALGDMLYILCGTILEHGMQYKIEEVFNEIQRSNMSKLGADGKPIYREDGKVLKGPDYFKPNIKEILE